MFIIKINGFFKKNQFFYIKIWKNVNFSPLFLSQNILSETYSFFYVFDSN